MAVSHTRGRSRSRDNREGPAFLDDLLAMAGSLANSRKQYASSQLETLADSVREFSDSLPSMPAVKTYANTAADSLEDLAGYVLESDLPEMVNDARELARRHPLATFGGSVLAGIVITQLVQSRAEGLRSAVRARRQRQPSRSRQNREDAEIVDGGESA